ncbi:hypothetical protein KQI52_06325 [bacterium]|nr:hypothetical protein [bacterium]
MFIQSLALPFGVAVLQESDAAFQRHQNQRTLPLHTLTADNGSEFARHEWLAERLGVAVYFAHP